MKDPVSMDRWDDYSGLIISCHDNNLTQPLPNTGLVHSMPLKSVYVAYLLLIELYCIMKSRVYWYIVFSLFNLIITLITARTSKIIVLTDLCYQY